ncbi:hypothetical protein [Epibacterium ulvae]|uniref:hypothetical protein n=1 Tax=Epibacterium ulvae TaxID=1156985 RepID=UPI0011137CF7|nr:hypothetical protein [Epibacterium ulvae]
MAALRCSNCGAPFAAQPSRPVKMQKTPVSHLEGGVKREVGKSKKAMKKVKKKKRKSVLSSLFKEAIDVIEDIFD